MLHKIFRKMHTLLHWFLLGSSFGDFGENFSPLFGLLNFPGMFLPLPVQCAVVPKVEEDVKIFRGDTAQMIDIEANLFRGDKESEMIFTHKLDMKSRRSTTQTRLERKGDRLLCQTEEKSAKSRKQEERSRGVGGCVVYRCTETPIHRDLELPTEGEVQPINKIRGGPHPVQREESPASMLAEGRVCGVGGGGGDEGGGEQGRGRESLHAKAGM